MKTLIVILLSSFMAFIANALTANINDVTWNYSVTDSKAEINSASLTKSMSITIPTELGGYPVSRVKDDAFRGNSFLTGVTIPPGIIIGDRAFYDCQNLEILKLLDGVTSIDGSDAFRNCTSLKTVTIPSSLTWIRQKAFRNDTNIERVNIGSVESYLNIDFSTGTSNPICGGTNASLYTNDVKIVDLVIPSGMKVVKPNVFNGNSSVRRIFIPASVVSIEGYAFDNCSSEIQVVFANDIEMLNIDFQGYECNAEVEMQSKSGCIFKGWLDSDGSVVSNPLLSSAPVTVRPQWQLEAPIISPSEQTQFLNESQIVSISCLATNSTIYYTTDNSDPKMNGRVYSYPFAIYKSCIVRAIAVNDDFLDSEEATLAFVRQENLSEAANMYGYLMETDAAHPWTVETDVSHDGVSSVRSGSIGNNETTYLQTSVRKAGTVSFWWRAACEEADEEEGVDGYYDYCAFSVDGVIVARIAGHDGEWHYVSHEITSGGKHVLKWEYSKDSIDSYSPDCIWVDQVQWVPADDSGYTLTTPEHVPYVWLKKYGFDGKENDFETAAGALSGKTQGGKATKIWEEFVAGTDPTNETSVLTAKIDMQEGVPVVTWEPNLNTNSIERLYKVYGKETLSSTEEWTYPTNSLHRFFKVTVEMP